MTISFPYQKNFFHNYINFEKTFYFLTLLYAFFVPFLKSTVSLFGVLFIVLWFLEGNLPDKIIKIKSSKALTAIVIFVAYMASTLLWSSDLSHGSRGLAYLLFWLIIPILSTSLKQEHIPKIITSFLLAMFISELIAYGMIFDLWTINGRGSEYPSPFMHHVPYSLFLALTAMILLYRLLSSEYSLQAKAAIFLFFLSVSGNLFFSIGRTGQLALLLGIIVSFILHYRLTWKSLISSLLLISLLFFSAYAISSNFQKRVHLIGDYAIKFSQGNLSSSWGLRLTYWIITYEVLLADPLLGAGLGDLNSDERNAALKKVEDYGFKINNKALTKGHLSNDILMVAFSGGLVGLSLFCYLIYQLIRLKSRPKELKDLSLIFLFVFGVGTLSEAITYRQYPMGLFVLFSALFITASMQKQKNHSSA